jgi:hypothetical protein
LYLFKNWEGSSMNSRSVTGLVAQYENFAISSKPAGRAKKILVRTFHVPIVIIFRAMIRLTELSKNS